jgi:hypothetical protein
MTPKLTPEEREHAITAAEQEASAYYAHLKGEDGVCHAIWALQKKILKEKYEIDWKSPAESNPGKMYD